MKVISGRSEIFTMLGPDASKKTESNAAPLPIIAFCCIVLASHDLRSKPEPAAKVSQLLKLLYEF